MNKARILVLQSVKSGSGLDIETIIRPIFDEHKINYIHKNVDTPIQATSYIHKNLDRFDTVFIYGGDGTVVAAVKALAQTDILLVIIPGGTGNFTAKHLGIIDNPKKIVRSYLENRYDTLYFDIAHTDDDTLALDMHIGWLAESTLATPRSMKKKFGLLAYGIQAVRRMPRQSRQIYQYTIDSNETYTTTAYTALFANKAIQNFFGVRLFNKVERQGTLEIAFIQSLNPIRYLVWAIGKLISGRNVGGFIKIHYAYKIDILQCPQPTLFDDFERVISLPYAITAGHAQTKILVPIIKQSGPLHHVSNSVHHIWYIIFEQVRNTLAGAPLYKYSQIMPRLYAGGSFRKKAQDEFKSWGITSIVNLRRTPDMHLGNSYTTLHLPTTDLKAPSLAQLNQGVRFIDTIITDGEGVYVHCHHGRGRGPTLVAAYLMCAHGMTVDQAIRHLRATRPMTRINQVQRKRLIEYKQSLHN